MKSFLENNDIEMCSKHSGIRLLLLKRFIRINKYITKIINTWLQFQKNVYINKLDDIVNKYNNIYHNTIKMKPGNVKWSIY